MTGQYAMFGEELQRGAEMAVRDVNARGGVNGEPLKLLVADDACDPGLAVQVAEELVRQGVVFVDGHFCSGASLPASKVYHDKGVLMITPGSINSRLTEQGFANVFRTCGRDDTQGSFAADYVVDNRLAERVAIVQDQSAFGQGIAGEFRKRLNGRGVREVMDEPISQGDNDFGALIARMRDARRPARLLRRLPHRGRPVRPPGALAGPGRDRDGELRHGEPRVLGPRRAGRRGHADDLRPGPAQAALRGRGGAALRGRAATAPRATRSTPTRRSRSSPRRPGARARPTSGRWRRRCTRAPTTPCSDPSPSTRRAT